MIKPFFYLAFGFIFTSICTYLELEIGLNNPISSFLIISEIIMWFWVFHKINN
jgi:hypothetical protein